jgi:hypothetical protein
MKGGVKLKKGNSGIEFMKGLIISIPVIIALWSTKVNAEWTPLITASNFTGVQTDVLTAGTGVLSIAVIILGLVFIIRTMTGR